MNASLLFPVCCAFGYSCLVLGTASVSGTFLAILQGRTSPRIRIFLVANHFIFVSSYIARDKIVRLHHMTVDSTMTQSSDPTSMIVSVNQTDAVIVTARPCPVGEEAILPDIPPTFFQHLPAPSNGTQYAAWEVALKVSAYALAMMTCAVGNFLVIVIVVMCRRMRTTTNLYVCNLAVSDIMVSLLCMWVHLGTNITIDWPFTANMCKVNNFFQGQWYFALFYAGILLLSLCFFTVHLLFNKNCYFDFNFRICLFLF